MPAVLQGRTALSAALYFLAVSMVAQLAPVAAAVAVRRRLSPALRLVAICFLLMFVLDAAGWWMAERDMNNLALGNFGRPVQTLLLLFALAEWETGETGRRAVRRRCP